MKGLAIYKRSRTSAVQYKYFKNIPLVVEYCVGWVDALDSPPGCFGSCSENALIKLEVYDGEDDTLGD